MLGAPELQKRLQSKLKSPNINDQFKAFAIKRLKANPPKTEAEQQTRIKQLQAQFVESLRQRGRGGLPSAGPQEGARRADRGAPEAAGGQSASTWLPATEDVDRIIAGMAERNKMTPKEFAEHVSKMGADISAMRERIKASLSWADVIRAASASQISIAGRDVDRWLRLLPGEDDVELHVHRILLPLPAKGRPEAGRRERSSEARTPAGAIHGLPARERARRPASAARGSTISASASRLASPSRRAAS